MTIHQTGRRFLNTSAVQNYKVGNRTRKSIDNIYWSLTDYFTKVLEDNLKAVVKPQYVDQIPKAVKGPDKTVSTLIKGRSQMENLEEILDVLGKISFIADERMLISLQN